MLIGEIKIGGIYKLWVEVETRKGEIQPQEILVRVVGKNEKGMVEITFPPFNSIRWCEASQLYPMG